MSDDRDRIRMMQERLAKLRAATEAADRWRTAGGDTSSPDIPARRPERRRGWLFIAGLVLTTIVFGELALTVQGWSAPDFAEAQRVGEATVVSCERRGPVGRGLGYWDRCTAAIVWSGELSERHTFDRRNFFDAAEVGTTVTVGEGTGSRGGGVAYSRPDRPHRPLAVALGVALTVIAAVPALFLLFAIVGAARNAVRGGRDIGHDRTS